MYQVKMKKKEQTKYYSKSKRKYAKIVENREKVLYNAKWFKK